MHQNKDDCDVEIAAIKTIKVGKRHSEILCGS